MGAINAVANLAVEGEIAILSINSPPVNALSRQVRESIITGIKEAIDNSAVKAIVLICEGKTFIAGADITEFDKPPQPPSLIDAQGVMENSPKPIIAAIHGTALGGGLGGAAGAVIGEAVGGREGAIIGGALGGGVGAAAGYDNERDGRRARDGVRYEERGYYYEDGRRYRGSDFCPPGQAKKGRC